MTPGRLPYRESGSQNQPRANVAVSRVAAGAMAFTGMGSSFASGLQAAKAAQAARIIARFMFEVRAGLSIGCSIIRTGVKFSEARPILSLGSGLVLLLRFLPS